MIADKLHELEGYMIQRKINNENIESWVTKRNGQLSAIYNWLDDQREEPIQKDSDGRILGQAGGYSNAEKKDLMEQLSTMLFGLGQ